MSLDLMHYDSEPITFDRSRKYEQLEASSYGKPRGFWVSVAGEDDWPSWCRSEGFALASLAVEHAITLTPGANILYIETAAELRAFHDQYSVETAFERQFSDLRTSWPIEWRDVAADYDGIIIAPYQWSQRLDVSWYYGWDCASGCIWNLDAIASLTVTAAVAS